MNKFLMILLLAIIPTVVACGDEASNFEKSVRIRAENEPSTAYDYFLEKIENGASIEQQAIYLYGMGIAHEKLGDVDEAVNDYMGAEILGYAPATKALQRIRP